MCMSYCQCADSCQDAQWDGQILSASCPAGVANCHIRCKDPGPLVNVLLNYSMCAPGSELSNNYGALICKDGLVAGLPGTLGS